MAHRWLLPIAAGAMLLNSCYTNSSATRSALEDDEVYLTRGEKFISDEVPQAVASAQEEKQVDQPQEDYYDADHRSENTTVNNYYGNNPMHPYYTPVSPWCGGYSGSGMQLLWDPWSGWYFGFSYGHSFGYDPWYDPWNDPWYNSGWGSPWNSYCGFGYSPYWYSPYGYNPYWNNPWYAGNGNADWIDSSGNSYYGHHSSVSSGSATSSSYTGGTLFDQPHRILRPFVVPIRPAGDDITADPSRNQGILPVAGSTTGGSLSERETGNNTEQGLSVNPWMTGAKPGQNADNQSPTEREKNLNSWPSKPSSDTVSPGSTKHDSSPPGAPRSTELPSGKSQGSAPRNSGTGGSRSGQGTRKGG